MTQITADTAIDFSHLKQYVGDDLALTAEVFGMFRHQTEMWSKLLTAKADDETWTSVTHTLKGSARAVGACGLGDVCEQAEALIGEGASHTARVVAVQDIEGWIDAVLHRIARWEYRQTLAGLRS
ncbi:MAG: Hpt domain-containing protein [Robiginitomaculum sp.]